MYQNLGTQPDTITFDATMGLVLGFSGGGEFSSLISLNKEAISQYLAGPFGGVPHFSGTSGATVTGTMSASGQTTVSSLSQFTGTGFADLYLSVTGELTRNDATGLGDAEGSLSVGASVVVAYDYDSVPEPSSWTGATLLLLACAGIAHSMPWKRRGKAS
jgi:hypothetical protein